MKKEDLEAKYKEMIESSGVLILHDAKLEINHRPHPFTIGPKHVAHAADHHCGKLGDETVKAIPCAHRNCGMAYEEHTHDTVMAIMLARDATQDEVREILIQVVDAGLEEDGIDGVIFVRNEPYDFI